jgi:hypothetical protein
MIMEREKLGKGKGERDIKTVLLHGAKNGSSLGYVGISAPAGIS